MARVRARQEVADARGKRGPAAQDQGGSSWNLSEKAEFERIIAQWFERMQEDVSRSSEKKIEELMSLHDCKLLAMRLNIPDRLTSIESVSRQITNNKGLMVYPVVSQFMREWTQYKQAVWHGFPDKLKNNTVNPGLYDRLINKVTFKNVFTWDGYTKWSADPQRYPTLEWDGEPPLEAAQAPPAVGKILDYKDIKPIGRSERHPRIYAEEWMTALWPYFHAKLNTGWAARAMSWANTLKSHAERLEKAVSDQGIRRITAFPKSDFMNHGVDRLMGSWMAMLQEAESFQSFVEACTEEKTMAIDKLQEKTMALDQMQERDINRFKAYNIARDTVNARGEVLAWLKEAKDVGKHVVETSTVEEDAHVASGLLDDLEAAIAYHETLLAQEKRDSAKLAQKVQKWRHNRFQLARDADVFAITGNIAQRMLAVLQTARLAYLETHQDMHEMPDSENAWRTACADVLRQEEVHQPIVLDQVCQQEAKFIEETRDIVLASRKEVTRDIRVFKGRIIRTYGQFEEESKQIDERTSLMPVPKLKPPLPKTKAGETIDVSMVTPVGLHLHKRFLRMAVVLLKYAEDTDPSNPEAADTWLHHVGAVRAAISEEEPQLPQWYWDRLPSVYALFVWRCIMS